MDVPFSKVRPLSAEHWADGAAADPVRSGLCAATPMTHAITTAPAHDKAIFIIMALRRR